MGEGWVVMLDTLRRVEALLDGMSFLGVSTGDPTKDMAIIGMIRRDMLPMVKKGLIYECQVIDQCQVHYSYKGYTIVVFWNENDQFTGVITTNGGQFLYSVYANSVQNMLERLETRLGIK